MAGLRTSDQRNGPRVTVACELHLARHVGNEVVARTRDLSISGARIVSDRPLRIDEELDFDLELPTDHRHVIGRARVLREDHSNSYALRFERVPPPTRAALGTFIAAIARAS